MYPLLLCRGAMPEIILTTIRPPSSIFRTHPPRLPRFSTRPHHGNIRPEQGRKQAAWRWLWLHDGSSHCLDTMMLQWMITPVWTLECGKGGESVVSMVCLYSLAGAKWEIIAAGGTLHRLESIHTANTDRKGCGQLGVLFDQILL